MDRYGFNRRGHALNMALVMAVLALLLAGGARELRPLTVNASGGADQQKIFAPGVRCSDTGIAIMHNLLAWKFADVGR